MTEKELIQTALKNWLPRLRVAQIDIQDIIENVRPTCETWRQWYAAMDQRGDMHKKLGDEALKAGNKYTAGQAYVLAANYYHFAKYVLYTEPDLYKEGTKKCIETYRLAAPLLDPPAERLVIPGDGFKVYAYLRKPSGVKNPPVVLCIPGSDSVKEELYTLEEEILKRGVATLTMDGPGQGEAHADCVLNIEMYKKAASKVLDYLDSRDDITHHYGTLGMSMGATLSFIIGSADHRFTAISGSGGASRPRTLEILKPLQKNAYKHLFDVEKAEDLADLLPTLDARPAIKNMKCPSLFVMGGRDTVVTVDQTEDYKQIPGNEYVLFPEGNHCCNNMAYAYRPLMADWLKAKLKA